MRKTIAMLLVAGVLTASTTALAYSDVGGHWAEADITKWSQLEIIKGADDKFRPDSPITRGEVAVIFDRVMGYVVASETDFSDLPTDFYTDAVRKLNASGILLGSEGRIRPTTAITREEAAVMFCRVLGLSTEKTAPLAFGDAANIQPWAAPSVAAMTARGYFKGDESGNFRPQSGLRRAEVVKLLDSTVALLQASGGAVTQTVEGNMVVRAGDVSLKNMTVRGDLYLAEGIAEGTATLTNVTVTGKTFVRGGGINSIVVDGLSSLGTILVEKIGTPVAVKVGSAASVALIEVNANGARITAEHTKVVISKTSSNTTVNGSFASAGTTVTPSTGGTTGGISGGGGGGGGGGSTPDYSAEKAAFLSAQKAVLGLSIYSVTVADKPLVQGALAAYEKLSAGAKLEVAEEKHLLDSLLSSIVILEQNTDPDTPAVGGESEYIPSDEV